MSKNWRALISKPQYGIREEKDVRVTMRDGIRLAVDVFRPDAPGQFPALLAIGGYGKDAVEMSFPPQPLFKSAVWDGNLECGDVKEFAPRGYVQVVCDVRGIGHSDGEYIGGSPTQEARDGYDLVEWAAQQPWCDGNVGMLGYSYYGMMQLKTAIQQPPHLKAVFVSHVTFDHYRGYAYNGGVLSLMGYGLWDGRHGTSGIAPAKAVSEMVKTLPPDELERLRQELLNDPDIKYYPNLYHLLSYPQKNPWFFDMLLNRYDGPYWRDRAIYPYYDKIQVPTYVIGKCAHEGGGFWEIYNGIKSPKKIFMKPTGPEERPWREDLELIIRWYDHWLKGIDTGIMDEPPIKLFVMGANRYRYEKEWPLPGVDYTKCYLRRWEGLSFEPELFQPDPDCFLQQPLHLSNARGSLKYISPPLPANLEVIGPTAFNFFASLDTEDSNWIVKLSDVGPGGAESRLGKGYLKASHRELDPAKSKPYYPYHRHTGSEPVKPGAINEYNVDLGVVSNVFMIGHRIKLEIESLESTRDTEFQIHYHPHLNSSRTTLHKIYRNRQYQSHLVLPIISGKEAVEETLSDENFQGGV